MQQHPLQSQNVKMLANHSKYSGFYSHVTTSSTCLPSWMSLGHKFWTLSLTVCHLQVLDRSWWRHLWNRLLKPPNYSPPPKEKALRVIALIATRFLWLHGVCIKQQLICKHSPTSLTASLTKCSPSKSLHFSNPRSKTFWFCSVSGLFCTFLLD